jgi:2-desacetyl-2-hydroxyethyl bacteriochlorophyllide A dehydrogenase
MTAQERRPQIARAAIWGEGNALDVREVAVAEPGPGRLLVRVRACGICGSDLHRFHTDTPAHLPPGIGPGHEIAGEVAALGPGVAGPPPGTPVAVMPGFVCDKCPACRGGRAHICPQLRVFGFGAPGGVADYVQAQAGFVYPLPPDMPWTTAALTEPAGIVVHGMKRAGLRRGQRVFVIGAGTIGLFAVLLAKDAGAAAIGVAARYPQQREAALALGATEVFDPAEVGPGKAEARQDWDLVVETVGGTAPTLQQAVDVAVSGGTVLLLGVHTGPVTLLTRRVFFHEVALIGAFGYDTTGRRADLEDAIALLDRYRERVAPLITHVYPLDRAADAFKTALDKRSGAIKVSITP